jgi:hypothetical protein
MLLRTQEVAVGNARPSVTKKQREQKKRERQAVKAERRAQRKIDAQNPNPNATEDDMIEYQEVFEP